MTKPQLQQFHRVQMFKYLTVVSPPYLVPQIIFSVHSLLVWEKKCLQFIPIARTVWLSSCHLVNETSNDPLDHALSLNYQVSRMNSIPNLCSGPSTIDHTNT